MIPEIVIGMALIIALVTDWRTGKIPNWLVLILLVCGVSVNAISGGFTGLIDAVTGMAIAALLFLPGYILWGMGAGDVKLAIGIGANLGEKMFATGLSIYMAGVVAGIIVLIMRKGVISFIRRWISIILMSLIAGKIEYLAPENDEAAATRFPYAVAIATGTVAAFFILR